MVRTLATYISPPVGAVLSRGGSFKFHPLSILTWVFMSLAVACSTSSVLSSGQLACAEFQTTSDSVSNGLFTPIEFRDSIISVQEQGSNAEPNIRDASARLLDTMTQGDGSAFRMATTEMFAACTDASYYTKGN